jgi:AcrR family transcriptional regulator
MAAIEEFIEEGHGGMRMESVARRAGVSKVSLYRRWRSKLEVTAYVLAALAQETPVVDRGSLAADIRSLFEKSIESPTARQQARVVMRTLGEMSVDPELAALYRTHLLTPRIEQLRGLVERARGRGEVADDVDTDVVCALVAGPLFIHHLMLLTEAEVERPSDLADRYARAILGGVARV